MFNRIKSEQSEYLNLLFVSDTFGNNDYTVNVKTNFQEFRYKLNDLKKTTKVSDLIDLCQNTLSSFDIKAFKVNNCDTIINNTIICVTYFLTYMVTNNKCQVCYK